MKRCTTALWLLTLVASKHALDGIRSSKDLE